MENFVLNKKYIVNMVNSPYRVGVHCAQNAKFRKTMEDRHCWILNYMDRPKDAFFAVFDGHGSHKTAAWAADNFAGVLEKNLNKYESVRPLDQIVAETFPQVDKLLKRKQPEDSGTTAAVVYIHHNQATQETHLYCANVGDTRIVLGSASGAYRLSKDHRASDPSEQRRIRRCGGIIYNDRVFAVLSITRALGDHQLKDYVIPQPYTAETVLEPEDSCLILACDGLWDVCEDEVAVELINDIDDCEEAAKVLVEYALKRRSKDNVTCMVIRWATHSKKDLTARGEVTNLRKRRMTVHHNNMLSIRRPPSPELLPSIWSESTPRNSDSEYDGDIEEEGTLNGGGGPHIDSRLEGAGRSPVLDIHRVSDHFERLSIKSDQYRYGIKKKAIPLDFSDSNDSDAILDD